MLVADVRLQEIAFELDTITVAAHRARERHHVDRRRVEQSLLQGALFSLDPTDLIALAAQIPGILA